MNINNFGGSASIGLHFNNDSGTTCSSEEAEWTGIVLQVNANNVVFDTGSFDYSVYEFIIEAQASENGVTLQNNASLYGCRFEIRGNFDGGNTNTGWVLGLDPGGAGAGTSVISGVQMYLNVETDNTGAGTVMHTSLVMGGSNACQFGGVGVLAFNGDAGPFQGAKIYSGSTSGNNPIFGFSGYINDPTLGQMPVGDGLAVYGGTGVREFAVTAYGTIYFQQGDVQSQLLPTGPTTFVFSGQGVSARRVDVLLKQPASGTSTVNWTGVKWSGGTKPVLSTANGAVDWLRFLYQPSTNSIYGELVGKAFS